MPRKVFVAGEILTAADVNTNLMDQSVMRFASAVARGSAIPTPTEGMVTYLDDLNEIQVYTGAEFAPIAKILQVVSTTKTDTFTSSSTSFTAITGLSASITPRSTANKVYAMVTIGAYDGAGTIETALRLTRGGVAIGVGDAAGSRQRANVYVIHTQNRPESQAFSFLDSPSSTSSLTYQVELRTNTSSVYVNRGDQDPDSSASVRASSTITLMEVAG